MGIFGILQFCISARCPDRCSGGARRLRIRSYFAVELDVNSLTATVPHTRRHIHAGTQDNERYGGTHSHIPGHETKDTDTNENLSGATNSLEGEPC